MNKKEVIEIVNDNFFEFIQEFDFELVKKGKNGYDLWYQRKFENGFQNMLINVLCYGSKYILEFGFGTNYDMVEDVLNTYNENAKNKINFSRGEKSNSIISFTYPRVTGNEKNEITNLGNETFDDIKDQVKFIKLFCLETALPLLDKFQDLRNLNTLMNGEDFWIDPNEIKYSVNNLYIVRLIIAKLAGNLDYEEVKLKTIKAMGELVAKNGHEYVHDETDFNKPLALIIHILKDIQPIY